MNRIKALPTLLANQIAAGEVVERPASVVKELVENAIDAGATKIEVELEQGGTMLIRVKDDGSGIEKDDLALAVSPHATSKIASTDDLAAVASLGFRGEALASIASVSQFTLTSKYCDAELAWKIECDGHHQVVSDSPAALQRGTVVEVRNLFFNTPARRKFLRAPKTELTHVEELINRLALSQPQVSLTLKHQGKVLKRFHSAQEAEHQQKRIAQAIEPRFLQSAHAVDVNHEVLKIKGWVGDPTYTRSQTDGQFIFINGRLVKDRTLTHAAKEAFQGLTPEGRQPSYVIYLELDPREVDVNVHPTKHEVRFSQPRMVHDLLASSVHQVLMKSYDVLNQGISLQNNQPNVEQTAFVDSSHESHFYQQHAPQHGHFEHNENNLDNESQPVSQNGALFSAEPANRNNQAEIVDNEQMVSHHYHENYKQQQFVPKQISDQVVYQDFYQPLRRSRQAIDFAETPSDIENDWQFLTTLDDLLVFKTESEIAYYDKDELIKSIWKMWLMQDEKGFKPFIMPLLIDVKFDETQRKKLQDFGFCIDWLDATNQHKLRILGVPHFFDGQSQIDWQLVFSQAETANELIVRLLSVVGFNLEWGSADWFNGINIDAITKQTAQDIKAKAI